MKSIVACNWANTDGEISKEKLKCISIASVTKIAFTSGSELSGNHQLRQRNTAELKEKNLTLFRPVKFQVSGLVFTHFYSSTLSHALSNFKYSSHTHFLKKRKNLYLTSSSTIFHVRLLFIYSRIKLHKNLLK